MLMKDMDKAVEILSEKIRERAAIRIIGDYDIDGVNATYILLEGAYRLGAGWIMIFQTGSGWLRAEY